MSTKPHYRFCAAPPPPALGGVPAGYKARAAMLNAAFWGAGTTLRVGFLDGSVALRERVRDLAKLWLAQSGANINFEFWTGAGVDPDGAEIRVAFGADTASWSHVGKYAGAVAAEKPTMNLGWMTETLDEAEARAVVLHEFGHALGLIHEHLSPVHVIPWDRARVTADLQARGWSIDDIDANMFAVFPPDQIFATDLDPHSIMMYEIPPEWTHGQFTAPWNSSLTFKDKRLVREAYGARPGAAPLVEG
ncbi:MAG TPA: hypothetical protein VGW40_04205 [Allosphingosinicella sp.]|nr:hypothetical protein [Allosphingosinicella sp.]